MKKIILKTINHSLILLMAGLLVIGIAACQKSPVTPELSSEPALTITKGNQRQDFTLAEIKAMPAVEGWGGIISSSGVISGPFSQKGIPLLDILETVGSVNETEAVRIITEDGYSVTYSYDQITSGNFTTLECSTGKEVPHDKLTVVISYEEEGAALTDAIAPLRIAILSSDTQVTEEQWWIESVEEIEVIYVNQPWKLHLEGALTEDITDSYFATSYRCHSATWTDDRNRVWAGIPLWLFVGRVDDDFKHNRQVGAFNDTVADAGYEVQVITVDGYTQTFTSAEVKRNNHLIVAFQRDGGPLPGYQWPLRLVGPKLDNSQMVGQIATIKVILP
ncbi:MAG: hypothetical protein WC369_09315 [Dehalococcoidales bacterium]